MTQPYDTSTSLTRFLQLFLITDLDKINLQQGNRFRCKLVSTLLSTYRLSKNNSNPFIHSMASTIRVAPTAELSQPNTTISDLRPNTRGAGRHRNRGSDRRAHPGQQDPQDSATQHNRARSNQHRGGGRAFNTNGSRGQAEPQLATLPNQPAPPLDPPPGPGGGGTFGNRLTKDATNSAGEVLTKDQDGAGDEGEAEVCFICASPVVHHSVAPCNHRTCHICALRLRALYKTRACAHCRVSPFTPSSQGKHS